MLLYKPQPKSKKPSHVEHKKGEEQKHPAAKVRYQPKKHVEEQAVPIKNTIDELPPEPAEKSFKGRGAQSNFAEEEDTLESDKTEYSKRGSRRAGRAYEAAGGRKVWRPV